MKNSTRKIFLSLCIIFCFGLLKPMETINPEEHISSEIKIKTLDDLQSLLDHAEPYNYITFKISITEKDNEILEKIRKNYPNIINIDGYFQMFWVSNFFEGAKGYQYINWDAFVQRIGNRISITISTKKPVLPNR